MKTNLAPILCVLVAGVAFIAPAHGQTSAATDPVGYTQLSCLANSDTRISIPFTRPAEFTGTIQSVSGSTITVAATPNWTANQFVYATGTQAKTYYAIIGPNLASVTGTVNVTSGSTSVTGTGTAFSTQLASGDALLVNGSEATVSSVTSDTAITLVSGFVGSTATGATAKSDRSPKEGAYYTVTANGSNTLTVNLNGDSLSTLAANVGNTSVTLIPYWTLGTAFPASDVNVSFVASTGTTSITRKTQLLFSDLTTPGFNLASSATYFNYNGAWRISGSDGTDSYDDTVLLPTTFFTVRNSNTATTFTPVGSVYMNRAQVPLDTLTYTAQDNAVALPRPVSISLNDLGLIVSGAFRASTGPTSITRGDTLLTYDNTLPGYNKASSAGYFYYNGGWRLNGTDGTDDYGAVTIPYGTGYTIRKGITTNGATMAWQNARNY